MTQNHFTQQILDSLPLGLHVVDREYRVCAWNRTRESGMQGVQRDDALGRSIFELLRRQPEEVLRREFDSVFRTGEILRFDIESSVGGDARVYRVSKIPMRDGEGVVTHVITIGEDVTEAIRAQEEAAQARKLAAVGTLAAGAMHEINNPLATIGAFAALFLTGKPIGVSAMIGFLMLIGIVVTNAIVLLDLVIRLRSEGHPLKDALIEGGRTRVRPILMTAFATILALIPLAAGLNQGSIIAAELGTVVIGGLFSSTLLTLIVVPVVYYMIESTKESVRRRFDRAPAAASAPEPEPAT